MTTSIYNAALLFIKELIAEGNMVESLMGKGVVGHLSLSLVILKKDKPKVVPMHTPVKRLKVSPIPPDVAALRR